MVWVGARGWCGGVHWGSSGSYHGHRQEQSNATLLRNSGGGWGVGVQLEAAAFAQPAQAAGLPHTQSALWPQHHHPHARQMLLAVAGGAATLPNH